VRDYDAAVMEGPSPNARGRFLRATAGFALAAVMPLGCANYIGTTSTSFLRRVRESKDPNIRFLAYQKLANLNIYDDAQQRAEAVRTLIAVLERRREPVASRAMICRTLGELGDPAAREVLRKATEVDADDPAGIIRSEACRALGKVGRKEDAPLLAQIMSIDKLTDCQIAAIEGLASLKLNDPIYNGLLVAGMGPDSDPAIRHASYQALIKITGQDLGSDPGPWRALVRRQAEDQAKAQAQARAKAADEKAKGTPAPARR
jgi:HEAT repeat protein